MLTTNRKGFTLGMPVSDNELWGIGLVSYQWSRLEHIIGLWTAVSFGGKAPQRSPGQRASFKERAQLLRETVEANAVEPWRARMVALVNQATGMQAERDKIIHWLWSEDDRERVGVADWVGGNPGTWAIDYAKLREIALKIDAISGGFFKLALETGRRPSAEGMLLSVAWQRICGIPNPVEPGSEPQQP